jgi:DNA-binding HxlR family transcriptional regulator
LHARGRTVIFLYLVVLSDCVSVVSDTKLSQIDRKTLDSCKIIHEAWNEVTRTWTLPTIHALGLKEPARFNELKRRIDGISATSLAERLTQLEKQGIVNRKVLPVSPPRVEYSLTVKGHELYKVLGGLAEWAKRWAGKDPNSREFIVAK